MLPLVNWLTNHGSDVYLVTLSGHHPNGIDLKEITASTWQEEMLRSYKAAREASLNNSVPLYFLGYSLGALLGQTMIQLPGQNVPFHKQILMAPAVAIRPRAYLLKCLFFFGKGIMIPSYTLEGHGVNKSLPLRIYQIIFEEERKFLQTGFNGSTIPTLIFIDPKDELISYRKLVQCTNKLQFSNYQLVALDDDLTHRNTRYHHLIIDEETMGRKNWDMATKKMEEFFFT